MDAGDIDKDRLLTSFCESGSLEFLNKVEGVRLAPSSEGFLFLIRSVVLLLLLALRLVGDSLSLLTIVTTASLSPRRGVSGLSSSSALPRIRFEMLLWQELQHLKQSDPLHTWLHNRLKVQESGDHCTAHITVQINAALQWISNVSAGVTLHVCLLCDMGRLEL